MRLKSGAVKTLIILTLGATSTVSADDPVVYSNGATYGTISNLSRQFVSGAWEISFTATVNNNNTTGTDSFLVFVGAANAGDIIRFVRVTANHSGDDRDWVGLAVSPYNPAFDSIPTLYEVSRSAGSNADLTVSATNIGQFGTSSVSAVISANAVSSLHAVKDTGLTGYTGDAYATITTAAGHHMEQNISDVQCDNNFFGSATAGHLIESFVALGNIGSSSSTANVSAADQIRYVSADRIWANISTSASNSFIQRLETTVGDLSGTVTTDFLSHSTSQFADGLHIVGDLAADVTFNHIVYYPITMTGALAAGNTLKIGEYATTGSTGVTIGATAGLHGQIILNSGNHSGQGWGAPVTIGPSGGGQIVLTNSAPYYTNHATQRRELRG